MSDRDLPRLGVVIVTFNARDVIFDCLQSLLAARGVALRIVVVDNGSPDDTAGALRAWARGTVPVAPSGDLPIPCPLVQPPVMLQEGREAGDPPALPGGPHRLHLIATGRNSGYAGGVNAGLDHLAGWAELDRFWILNPDSVVPPDTPARLATAPGGFALMGSRVIYLETPDRIQIDAGEIDWRTGVTRNRNQYAAPATTPEPVDAPGDFIMGGNMVASRAFLAAAGPMSEGYFLYYEEVDWALARGALPLAFCPQAPILHRGGTAIGSPAPGRSATPFALFFRHRARLRFVRRHLPRAWALAMAYSLAKAFQLAALGQFDCAGAVLQGSLDRPLPDSIRQRLGPEAAALASRQL